MLRRVVVGVLRGVYEKVKGRHRGCASGRVRSVRVAVQERLELVVAQKGLVDLL